MSSSRGRGGKGPNRPRGPGRRPGSGGPGGPEQPPQVGKRPSNPLFLFTVALAWLAAGAIAYFGLHRTWRLIPVICFVGVGLLYLRGAAGSYLRREGPPAGGPTGGRK